DVAPGSAQPIADFYREIIGAPASVTARTAHVRAGWQELVFRESDAPLAANDGHHIQIYIADFSTPHRKLLERGLIAAENNAHEYRFIDIAGRFTLEHEVRS